ncbi:MAG: DUF3617 domain-containing protein [Rhizorhabdus sp.]
MNCRTISIYSLLWTLPAAVQAQVQAGQWEASTTINSIDMPGAPPQVAQMMKSQMAGGGKTRMTYCITPEQAAQGPQEMLRQNPACRFSKYSMRGGLISTEMSCRQSGGTMTARANGSYTPTSFNVTSNAVMSGRMSMRLSSTSVGRRIGPCTGK